MLNRISFYVFIQIFKACTLIFFIFISISWLLQITRLFSLTNLLQVEIITIFLLSLFLLPNLITIILPFVVIFGIALCFVKLNKDKELLAIYSCGLNYKVIRSPLIIFTLLFSLIYITLNFYISPLIYDKYKQKEFQIRNTINFEKLILSNFLEVNQDTVLDFKKTDTTFKEIFINFKTETDNLIFANSGNIFLKKDLYVFELNDGFKLNINEKEIEKLEFKSYTLKIPNNNILKYNNFDKNTLTIFDDIKTKNYSNITFKISDILIFILIIFLFYKNNILTHNFKLSNNVIFIIISILTLIINQIAKNTEIVLNFYLILLFLIITSLMSYIYFTNKRNE